MRNRKRAWLAVPVALVATLAVGVGLAWAHGTKSAKAHAVPSGTYKIGFFESITGRLAFYDPIFAQGMKLRIKQINAKGGVGGKLKLQLVEQDGKSDPAQGAVVARSLVGDGVKFGVSPCDQDISIPGAQIFANAKIPVVMSCGSGWTFPEVVGPYAFDNLFGTAAMGAAQAEFAASKGWKRACDFSSNDYFYGKNTSDNFEARFKQLGGKVVCHVYYKLTDNDFRAVATQIAKAKPDFVTTTLVFPGSTTFLKQLRAQGYKGPLLWSDSIDSNAALAAGSALNNVFLTTHACPQTPATATFFKQFKKSTGKAPDAMFVATGGDLVDLIAAAIQKAGSDDPTKVRDAFASLQNVKTVSGTVTYKGSPENGVPKKNVYVLQWKGRQRVCVKGFYPKKVLSLK